MECAATRQAMRGQGRDGGGALAPVQARQAPLADLLAPAREGLLQALAHDPPPAREPRHPAWVLFFVLCDGHERAHVEVVSGDSLDAAWRQGAQRLQALAVGWVRQPVWLRVEAVHGIEQLAWSDLCSRLARTKRNYFRYGLAFDPGFRIAMLEHEICANALLYDTAVAVAHPNEANLRAYGRRRFGRALHWPQAPDAPIWRFKTRAVFVQDGTAHVIEHEGYNSGYRKLAGWGADTVRGMVQSGTAYLAAQVRESGQFHYGWFPCFDRAIPTYNALRHASSTYALLEGWALQRDPGTKAAIERALDFLEHTLIHEAALPGGQRAAFLVDAGQEIKLGGNAVCLLAFAKYAELTGERRHLPLMQRLGLGILHMQDRRDGSFVHVLRYPNLQVKEKHRIIYYDGEAAFGLMRLYGLTRQACWLDAVEQAFTYFIAARHWQAHDHWLSYCVNELTLYRPQERYYRFGLDNVRDHLDFVQHRITTYPTLLELMMAARQMIGRLQADPALRHLLEGFDLAKFDRALAFRARYLASGFFWPELAMFFKNPARILGSFFIRHHTFRVRIDDVEHYLSGLIAYWQSLKETAAAPAPACQALTAVQAPAPAGPTVIWGGDVNLGRRQHYRSAELGAGQVLRVPALARADLTIVNLECVVATGGEQGRDKGEGGPYYYRARPEMLALLAEAGVNVVSTANNHAGDYGSEALLEQAAWIEAAGMAAVGSGASRARAFAPVYREAGGLTVAVFGLDTTQRRYAAGAGTPGTAYLPPDDPDAAARAFRPLVARARRRAHVVLLALHAGANGAGVPAPAERALCRALIDAGFDAVLGASAHRLQGVEIHAGRPIIHDAGDLLFDAVRTGLAPGGVFQLELGAEGVRRVSFLPVGIGFGQAQALRGEPAFAVLADFAVRCRELGTTLLATAQGTGYVDLDPPPRSAPPMPRGAVAGLVRRSGAPPPVPEWTVAEVPADARLDPVALGPLMLLGMRVRPAQAMTRREMIWVESFWMAPAPVEEDLRLDIQAVPVPANGMPPWGKGMDHDPCDWMMPTSRWRPARIYRDFYGLRPPRLQDWVNGTLQLHAGLVGACGAIAPRPLPLFVGLAVPGKDPAPEPAQSVPVYRQAFSPEELAAEPGRTWTARQLASITGGRWLAEPGPGWFVRSVVAGPRHIGMLPDPVLFVGHDSFDRQRHEQSAMPARNVDRHAVIPRHRRRLAGAIVARPVPGLAADFPLLRVDDPIKAMIELGIAGRARYRGPVVAVTGTAGKSTTVEMITTLLGGRRRVLASIDNYNSRVGAPALLASLSADHAAAVVEVAQSALWMKRGPVTRLLRPTIAVITEIGLSQTDARVRRIEDAVHWKTRVFDGLQGEAVAIVGEHLPCFEQVLRKAREHARRIIVFGQGQDCAVRYETVDEDAQGSTVRLTAGGQDALVRVPLPGPGAARSAVAAYSVLHALGLDLREHAGRARQFQALQGRMQVFEAVLQGRRFQVIDDSFNATVIAMHNAFAVLKAAPDDRRKIAVLGRMVHLGELAPGLHRDLAQPLLDSGVALVATHGQEMLALREVLPDAVLGPHFSKAGELADYLLSIVQEGDLLLLKGSRRDSDFAEVARRLLALRSDAGAPAAQVRAAATPAGRAGRGQGVRPAFERAAEQAGWRVQAEPGAQFALVAGQGSAREIFHRGNVGHSIVVAAATASGRTAHRLLQRHGLPVAPAEVFNDREPAWRWARDGHGGLREDRAQAYGMLVHGITVGCRLQAACRRYPDVQGAGGAADARGMLHAGIVDMLERAAALLPGASMLGWDLALRDPGLPPEDGNAVILAMSSRPDLAAALRAGGGDAACALAASVLRLLSCPPFRRPADGAPRIAPAARYVAACGGASFPRSYATQARLVRQAAFARDLAVETVGASLTLLAGPDGRRVGFYDGMCCATRAVARRASNDKAWTKSLLARAGIPTPQGQTFAAQEIESAWAYLGQADRAMVVKPVSGSGGAGVSTRVSTRAHFEQAWAEAAATGAKRIICEPYVAGNDYRVVVIGNAIRAVTHRIAAHVAGDGRHTVQELVDIKNEARQANPYTGAKKLALTPMILRNLRERGLSPSSVLPTGAIVQLHTVANVGAGGESVDVTESVHPAWAEVAVRARQAIYDAPHAGLDVIAQDIARPPAQQQWTVIEVNTNPDLGLQHFPVSGAPRDVAGALLEHLFGLPATGEPPRAQARAVIRVKAQRARFCDWVWRSAHQRALHGWIRELHGQQAFEAVFAGPPNAVRHMLDTCAAGPPSAQVLEVAQQAFEGPVEPVFLVLD